MTSLDPSGEDAESAPAARRVRPYTITSGRTSASVDLPVEASLRRVGAEDPGLGGAAYQVLQVCDRRSVAEVSALTSMPIGVVRQSPLSGTRAVAWTIRPTRSTRRAIS